MGRKAPRWLSLDAVTAVHVQLLAAFGGSAGVRDHGLLESALARPRHIFTYEKAAICDLAAAYAYGIARNHPFVDGNKRTAFMAAYIFLERNGFRFDGSEAEVLLVFRRLATGELSEKELSLWLKRNCKRPPKARSKSH